jgi:hypothetical protein
MNRHNYTPDSASVLKARVAAALTNNPRITAKQLADQTGLTLGAAIAQLEGRK